MFYRCSKGEQNTDILNNKMLPTVLPWNLEVKRINIDNNGGMVVQVWFDHIDKNKTNWHFCQFKNKNEEKEQHETFLESDQTKRIIRDL